MKIFKYGHACLLVEVDDAVILVDPGAWNPLPTPEKLDAVLITHEHFDHCDIDQLKQLILQHPQVRVITHEAVAGKLKDAGIIVELIKEGEKLMVNGVSVQSFGHEHQPIYGPVSPCQNTGYLVAGMLFAPGDALQDVPPHPVKVLALPTGGPWMRVSEAIDYAKSVKPEIVIPIHDAMYVEEYRGGLIPRVIGGNLEQEGIKFVDVAPGTSFEI